MSSRIIKYVTLILIFVTGFAHISKAQETYCYRLTGIVVNGAKTAPNTTSRIFVTFSKDICYDSDREGFSGHYGLLRRTLETAESVKYSGNCYFGMADYIVSKSKDLINVWGSDGKVYIYTRETPPAQVTQSSYGNLVCHYTPETKSAPITYPTMPDNPTVNSSPSKSSHRSHELPCRYCNSSGKCSYCAGRGWKIIGDSIQDCIMCHGSGRCPSCHGKGTIHD